LSSTPKIDQDTDYGIFIEYSAKNWSTHFREANIKPNTEITPLALRLCNPTIKGFLTWFDIYKQSPSYRSDFKPSGALILASYLRFKGVVKLLLKTGKVDVDSKDMYGQTPLWWAARNGHEAVVKLLLETGKVDVDSKDKEGQTPLRWAAENGHEAVVKLLLETGKVDVDSKDMYGRTPLRWAARNGHEAVVKLLLETIPT